MNPPYPGQFPARAPMQVTCAVCETPQPPATLCANCGMALKLPAGVRPVGDPPVERLEGLEQTRFDDALAIADEMVPGLESTSFDAAPELRGEAVPGFEATAELDVLDLPGDDVTDLLPDLEPTGDSFDRTPGLSGEVPAHCPWCGFTAPTGRVCDNCGRSRTRVLPRPATAAGEPEYEEGTRVRCRACGATVFAARLCSDCGNPIPPPSDE